VLFAIDTIRTTALFDRVSEDRLVYGIKRLTAVRPSADLLNVNVIIRL